MKISQEKANEIVKLINEGETLSESTKVVISQGRYYPKDIEDFVMLFQKITEQAIKNLKPASAKVMLYMLCKLQWSNHIGINQITMAEECDISKPSIARAIRELLELKIIITTPDPQDKRRNIYIINPYSAWKGKVKHRKKAIQSLQGQLSLQMPEQIT